LVSSITTNDESFSHRSDAETAEVAQRLLFFSARPQRPLRLCGERDL